MALLFGTFEVKEGPRPLPLARIPGEESISTHILLLQTDEENELRRT